MNLERFDDFFFTIVKETGGLEGLFHALFNFLFRRTDFFYESNPGDKMGFPPGVAPQIYQNEQYKKIPKKDPQEYQKKVEEYKKQQQQQQQVQEKQSQQKEQIITEKSNLNEKESKEQKEQKDQKEQQEQKENYDQQQQKPQQSEQKIRKPIDSKIGNISTWNGDTTDKYSWSQSTNDITLQVNVPEKTRAKDVINLKQYYNQLDNQINNQFRLFE